MKLRGKFLWWVALLALISCAVPFSVRHEVGPREDLAAIAASFGVSERDLREFNHLEAGDRVRPGDILFVPGGGRPTTPLGAPSPAPATALGSVSPPAGPPAVAARPRSPTIPAAPPPSRPAPEPPPTPPRIPAPPPPPPGEGRPLRWPAGGDILRGFGTGPTGESRGIDLSLPQGTTVDAAAAGTVTYAGTPAEAYGPLVILEHEGGLFTVYGNLSTYSVERGQRVTAGAAVGTSGGKHGDLPPHLHFEVRRGQQAVDPLLFLPPR